MMDRILFRNVKITDLHSPYNGQQADVLVAEGRIVTIAEAESLSADGDTRLLEGGHLSPGWLDLRVHLHDPGEEWRETLGDLARAAVAGGYTAILALPHTTPVLDNGSMVRSVLTRAAHLPVRLLLTGAISVGTQGVDMAELYDMHQAGAVAFTDGWHPVPTSGLALRALQYLKPFGGRYMSYPMDVSLAGHASVGEGATASRMGMKGIPRIAEEMQLRRDLLLLEHFPQQIHFGPLTMQESAELVQKAKEDGGQVTADVSAFHLSLDDAELEEFDANFKIMPPLREKPDVAALRQALVDGHIDAVSSCHFALRQEDKEHEFPKALAGAIGLETAFAAVWDAMQDQIGLDVLVERMTAGPRRVLGLETLAIEEQAVAELTWFDPEKEWLVSEAGLASPCKNSPYLGRKLRGKALATVVNGQLHLAEQAALA